jgi:hypothetical protein
VIGFGGPGATSTVAPGHHHRRNAGVAASRAE